MPKPFELEISQSEEGILQIILQLIANNFKIFESQLVSFSNRLFSFLTKTNNFKILNLN